LCINARDALKGSGSITIAVSQRECPECNCDSCKQAFSGQFVELSVTDNGSGIPQDVMDRMFEPFYSTKEVGKGSGMGLSTVHGIVHEYDGHIKVKSKFDKGTSISILFRPLSQSKTSDEEYTEPKLVHQKTSDNLIGRVLLVDDEQDVIDFMQDMLESWGLEVVACNNSPAALEIFKRESEKFSLVITDNTMPKITGTQLAGEIHNTNPELPIILYTGYSEDIKDMDLNAIGIKKVIRKPIDVPETRKLIKKLLE